MPAGVGTSSFPDRPQLDLGSVSSWEYDYVRQQWVCYEKWTDDQGKLMGRMKTLPREASRDAVGRLRAAGRQYL